MSQTECMCPTKIHTLEPLLPVRRYLEISTREGIRVRWGHKDEKEGRDLRSDTREQPLSCSTHMKKSLSPSGTAAIYKPREEASAIPTLEASWLWTSQTSEFWEIHFCCLTIQFTVFCYGSPSWLTHITTWISKYSVKT